jgi:hypothetical protein
MREQRQQTEIVEDQQEVQQKESSPEISVIDYKSLEQLLAILQTIGDEEMAQAIMEICNNEHKTKAAHKLSEDLSPELLQKLNLLLNSTEND